MPKYVYACSDCNGVFETKHSLNKTCTICELCGIDGEMVRIPTSFYLNKKTVDLGQKNKPGELMKATIKDAHEDLKQEKEKLRSRTYDGE